MILSQREREFRIDETMGGKNIDVFGRNRYCECPAQSVLISGCLGLAAVDRAEQLIESFSTVPASDGPALVQVITDPLLT